MLYIFIYYLIKIYTDFIIQDVTQYRLYSLSKMILLLKK